MDNISMAPTGKGARLVQGHLQRGQYGVERARRRRDVERDDSVLAPAKN